MSPSFLPLICIPVYDNERTIGAVVAKARAHGPVLVIDDGSRDRSADNAERAGATLVRHPLNRGKGEALKTAWREAKARGFTHVLSIDGDGQHEPDDIPQLLELARQNPDAIVLGSRALDAIPGRNQFGNRVSNFWVNLALRRVRPWRLARERFSDTQCGLRVYPLHFVDRYRLRGAGYELETEVLIRHTALGAPLRAAPVTVYYPDDRVSHFVPSRDATRIVFLVMRFLFLPRLLWALAMVAGCATEIAAPVVAAPATDKHQAALAAWSRPFVAEQLVTIQTPEATDAREAQAQLIAVPGVGYRMRVFGPFMVTVSDVIVLCDRFSITGRSGTRSGALVDAGSGFPARALQALFRAPDSAELAASVPAFARLSSGEVEVRVDEHMQVADVWVPRRLTVKAGAVSLRIVNQHVDFDLPSPEDAARSVFAGADALGSDAWRLSVLRAGRCLP